MQTLGQLVGEGHRMTNGQLGVNRKNDPGSYRFLPSDIRTSIFPDASLRKLTS